MQAYRHHSRDTVFRQRHAVKGLGLRHGRVVMSNDEELLLRRQSLEDPVEPKHVGIIERRINLIQDIERTGIDGLQREQERQGCQRALTTGKKGERLQPLAWRLRQDLDAVVQRVAFRLAFQTQGSPAALKQLTKELLEVHGDSLKDGAEASVDFILEALAQFRQLSRRLLEIAQLPPQPLATIAHLCVLIGRQ